MLPIELRYFRNPDGSIWHYPKMDERNSSLPLAIDVSGIDERQLRNGLSRGTIKIGEQDKNNQWRLSLREIFVLTVMNKLNTDAMLPPKAAFSIASAVKHYSEVAFELGGLIHKVDSENEGASDDHSRIDLLLVSDSPGTVIDIEHIHPKGASSFYRSGDEIIAPSVLRDLTYIKLSLTQVSKSAYYNLLLSDHLEVSEEKPSTATEKLAKRASRAAKT
ncbi:hypothetical protein ACSMXM_15560 [Pacificimonas sp. ICDLI1SI03]